MWRGKKFYVGLDMKVKEMKVGDSRSDPELRREISHRKYRCD
jgi:hypothetical protein